MSAAPYTIHTGDCLDVLRGMEPESVDAIVTDPPAGIAFMGKAWDRDKGGRDAWVDWMRERAEAALALAKPGAHALVWALPRTSHWTATAWEDAGWEVRDRVSHLFGQGFPKGGDLGKKYGKRGDDANAEAWEGWSTTLKPAMEDWWLLRKPTAGSVLDCVAAHGTGALNVDACRVGTEEIRSSGDLSGMNGQRHRHGTRPKNYSEGVTPEPSTHSGRWPAHLVHDGSPEVLEAFGRFGERAPGRRGVGSGDPVTCYSGGINSPTSEPMYSDTGTAARFFYCAKASRAEREAGLDGWEAKGDRPLGISQWDGQTNGSGERMAPSAPRRNTHPTVKPRALMAWLCRLVTPPGGTVLDPFTGSGSTGAAAVAEGFRFVGVEQSPEFAEIARARVAHAFAEAAEPTPAPPPAPSLFDAPAEVAA